MTILRDAQYIRLAERRGYPTGEEDGELLQCGEAPTLPRWLWSDEEEPAQD